MNRRILALDVGNSRIKWGLADATVWIGDGAVAHDAARELYSVWDGLPNPDCIVGSNVLSASQVGLLSDYWRRRGIPVTWIRSSEKSCGVSNGYDQPERLGTDRWAALIGAWNRIRGSCLVVSAGTATTIDALDSAGRFIGGQILPGRRLMQQSLSLGTYALNNVEDGQVKDLPCNSADAIASGIAIALACAVEQAFNRLQTLDTKKPACLISGGDAQWLAGQLHITFSIEPKLVLAGLVKMAEEESGS